MNKIKIIALPYAGGSKYCYREFESSISDQFEWITYELPGRGSRIQDDFLLTIDEIIDDLYKWIVPQIKSCEYVIYGHSLGSILGVEIMRKVLENKLQKPLFLFFSGRGAPNVMEKEKFADLKSDLFWLKLKNIGGIQSEIFENVELKEFLEPIIRSDFKAVENYKFVVLEEILPVPIYISIGNQELLGKDEEKVKWEHILDWQKITKYAINVKFYKGNHFFIKNNYKELCNEFSEILKSNTIFFGLK